MNYCEYLAVHAVNSPELPAIRYALADDNPATVSYRQLFSQAGEFQRWMANAGLTQGARVLLLLSPGPDFYRLFYAMLGAGIVPVLLEKGFTIKQLRHCLMQARLTAMVVADGMAKRWFLLPELWRIRRFSVDSKRRGMAYLPEAGKSQTSNDSAEFRVTPVNSDDTALITFTSGSTGMPKGVIRSHRSLLAQSRALADYFPEMQQNDMSSFPVLTLFSHYGAGCSHLVTPPGKDGLIDAPQIVLRINRYGLTRLSASPAWIAQILACARELGCVFPSVQRLVIGGAPVNKALLLACLRHFPFAHCGVNYGSTEAEPVSYIDMVTLLEQWEQQPGYLVGAPGKETRVIIRCPSPSSPQENVPVPDGEIGEIIVSGPQVLERYLNNPEANYQHKIRDREGRLWHSTGDSGFLDASGRIWLTGRIKDEVRSRTGLRISPFTVEKMLNDLPGVGLSALIQGAEGEIAVVLQNPQSYQAAATLAKALLPGENIRFYHAPHFPMDPRHHSRVDRGCLRKMRVQGKLTPLLQGAP
ncbi:Acyl-CoA synthetase (AMP-forming)/AMP-acid ligase II [Kosakonia sacchari]|nr:Acyl-CoA synthetase (AMP-forming)/AMP-acid ligase II [Kosakonia sacchari]